MNFSIDRVRPLLSQPLLPPHEQVVIVWLAALSAILTGRYGDRLKTEHEPVALVIVAAAISRKLDAGRTQGVVSQSAGPARIQYTSEAANATGWLLPGELDDLDQLCGLGGTRSVRLTSDFGDRRSWRPLGDEHSFNPYYGR